eukprot:s1093_g4.t1
MQRVTSTRTRTLVGHRQLLLTPAALDANGQVPAHHGRVPKAHTAAWSRCIISERTSTKSSATEWYIPCLGNRSTGFGQDMCKKRPNAEGSESRTGSAVVVSSTKPSADMHRPASHAK